jgi:hypothetical protein
MNLSYQSRNIDKLLQIDKGEKGGLEREIKDIVDNYKIEMDRLLVTENTSKRMKYQESEPILPRSLEYTPEQGHNSPQFNPNSPQFQPGTLSSQYDPNSPQFNPNSPQFNPNSPQFNPNSPQFNPNSESPQFAPDSESPQFAPNSPQFSSVTEAELPQWGPRTPEESPSLNGGGQGANIFSDTTMNDIFNRLSGEQQSKILQLPEQQRGGVMQEIIRRSMKGRAANLSNKIDSQMDKAFQALPLQSQAVALQGGYASMANQFKSLAKSDVSELGITTIKNSVPVSEALSNKLPLLAVKTVNDIDGVKDNDNDEKESENKEDDKSSSFSSSSSTTSASSGIKKIIFN